ncbi:hypothetical protein LTV02_27430 [Nocardia yamanashiensis]|uniref:hypothetical protein n=1 Tax=Nocardia yamanashiensis TaxID=209247 RepID=UPI001E5C0B73|nr:hypothetical protein [Nocardia yamanashiensis]UGT39774.1 hypothetical protein LTV02_27430 [Nocardia yamanashiensis]
MNPRLLATSLPVLACLLITGCGDGASPASTGTPATPREQLLLAAGEFPAGTKHLDIPADKLRAAASDVASLQSDAVITPESCRGTQIDAAKLTEQALQDSSVAAASADATVYVEFVASRVADLKQLAANNDRCKHLTGSNVIDGDKIDTKIELADLPAPGDLKGVDTLVYLSDSSSTAPGVTEPITSTAYMGWATLRDTTVAVRVASMSGPLDRERAERFFVDAVRKIQDAN